MRSEALAQGFPTAGRGAATRSGLRSWIVVVLVGVVAALGCVAALLVLPGGTAGRATTARHSLESLPLSAQGPVSSALGQDEPVYRVAGLEAVNPAQHLHAGFSRRGVTVASGKARLGVALSAYGYAGALEPVGSVAPRASANRVTYTYAGLTAWYANGPLGLEQGFTVAHAPAGDAVGPLAVSLALSGNVVPRLAEDGHGLILVRGGHTVLRYAAMRASDARGRVLRSWLALERGRVVLRVGAAGATYPLQIDPLIQQGEKLTGTGQTGGGYFGYSVALSADGSTALIGGDQDDGGIGAAWVFTRSGSTWTQQGGKLTGSGEDGGGAFGTSVALSADGDTALIGGWSDKEWDGAAWVFTRSGETWTQQGPKLSDPGRHGELDEFGTSVALSADGNTALVGAPRDNNDTGAAWVFTRSGSTWTQQGGKLTGSGASGGTYYFGKSVALSGDGNTALVGGSDDDDSSIGAAWVFTRSGSTWTQQGSQLTGSGETGDGSFGESVALSGDGSTALVGGPQDNNWQGAAWVFTRSGSTWTQQGGKLTGKEEAAQGNFGTSVALSEDGSTALVGAGLIDGIGTSEAAAWMFTRSGSTWTQQGSKLTGAGGIGENHFGLSVALSADGNTALIGGPWDNDSAGAAWVFTRSGETWSQDGEKLTGPGQTGNGEFGYSVALSADGNTAVIGGPEDNDWIGAAWVFTRSGETWTQQGAKLLGNCANDCADEGTGETGDGRFGESVAVSANGEEALIGAPRDGSSGAVWVFTRSGETWTQQGGKLTGKEGGGFFGYSVALAANGDTALIGAPSGGAAYVFTRSGETWAQQGSKLTGTGETGKGSFGTSVALSEDGEEALIGRPCDYFEAENCLAAAWVFTRSGSTWTQQGSKLTGTGETAESRFGESVALSGDGDTALIGDPTEHERHGAAFVFTRSGETWTQQGSRLTAGDDEYGEFGDSVALSGNGNTALIGEPWDNGIVGAAWLFTRSGETWTQDGSKIAGTGENGLGKFGSSVAISNDGATMLIGGPTDNGAGSVWPYVLMQLSLPSDLSFGSQTTDQPGPVLWMPVKNTGPAPVTLGDEAQIGGTDASDFTIPSGDDLCASATLEPEQTCSIGVQFTASETGQRYATLSMTAGNGYAPTASLTGTGVAASTGPIGNNETKGETGPAGPAGPQGSAGPTGPTGSTGPTGKEGPAGKIEIVTCTKKDGKQTCTTKLVTGPVKFTTTASAARATLSRKRRVVATGTVHMVDGHVQFVSNDPLILPRGRYTLTITHKTGRHITETREGITIT